jgi:hypothetical protein
MPVKDEDLDWMVYHILSNGKTTEESIVRETGFSPGDIKESLNRLKSNLLIDCKGDSYDILSIPEMLFRCQCRYEKDTPLVIDNGIIKVRKPEQ